MNMVQEDHSKKCRWFRFKTPCCKLGRLNFAFSVRLNPVVSLFSALLIWGFVVWCVMKAKAANEEMVNWRGWITLKCTWLYIGTQDVWALFIIVLYLSKYSKMKLGKPHEKPEFNDATYFTMLFARVSGLVCSTLEYSDNQRAQDAMNVTFFHWGIHGWIVYVLVGLLLGFLSYRKGLPMDHAILLLSAAGDRIYGWYGRLH
ncbi:hypothetical protein OS493_039250 [Desmophyllum pertusum]|uniref:Uncharacterized protein n=1 Tax=Desmophyllum pertusum TaxID=174260 RepID=A0A9X0CU69_9CNID|nr:hypothetical protein OS493_039250 [Desmophyllum pertusum]